MARLRFHVGFAKRTLEGTRRSAGAKQHKAGFTRRPLEPLERTSEWEVGELPESYPWGM
jgi:hypothetical protein